MAKKRKLKRGVKCILLIIFAAVVAGCGYLIYRKYFQKEPSVAMPISVSATPLPNTIEVDGVTYEPKSNVYSYLFMGIGHEMKDRYGNVTLLGGQADAQMLLVIDDINKTWQMLQINRDSMVDVPVLGVSGEVVETTKQQICLAHSYGDGKEESCINAEKAVSGMLKGRQIDGYVALDLEGIPTINDDLGDVTVTIKDDFSQIDSSLVQGQTITLNGTQALHYIQSRGNVGDQTNLNRMARQREYLTGLFSKLSDIDVAKLTKTVSDANEYITSGISLPDMVSLLLKMKKYENLGLITIDGTSEIDENGFNAYYLDEDSLEQAILQLYYQPTAVPTATSSFSPN